MVGRRYPSKRTKDEGDIAVLRYDKIDFEAKLEELGKGTTYSSKEISMRRTFQILKFMHKAQVHLSA